MFGLSVLMHQRPDGCFPSAEAVDVYLP